MVSIILDSSKLELLKKEDVFNIFTNAEHNGKIRILDAVFNKYFNNNECGDYEPFARLLYEVVGVKGLWMMLTTVEGDLTQSWRRGCSVNDVILESEKILNDEEYRLRVNTEYTQNPGMFDFFIKKI
ncbi:MAG: hypothetical protein JW791_03005 [Nanoarchaeota archaeon]|nr:hypothetical protein [Nanoarchaeota archaeon]